MYIKTEQKLRVSGVAELRSYGVKGFRTTTYWRGANLVTLIYELNALADTFRNFFKASLSRFYNFMTTKYIGILWYLRLVNRVLIGDQSHFITPLLKNSLREIKPARKSISDLRPLKISDYLIIHFTMSGEWAMKMLLKLDKLPKLTKCMIDNLKFWLTFFRSVLLCPDCLFRHILQFNSLHIDRILG